MKRTTKLLTGLVLASFLLALGSVGAQPGPNFGRGTCCLQPNLNQAAPAQSLSDVEKIALDRAIQDEYKSRATYNKVLDTFGAVRPFANIVQAEGRHVDMLAALYTRYNLPLPADTWATKVPTYTTLLAAAEASVQGEIDNGALYDGLMDDVTNTDLLSVFNALQFATMEHHLPAFQRFVARQGGDNIGVGRGAGAYGRRGCCAGRTGNGRGTGAGNGVGRGNGQGNGRGYWYNQSRTQ